MVRRAIVAMAGALLAALTGCQAATTSSGALSEPPSSVAASSAAGESSAPAQSSGSPTTTPTPVTTPAGPAPTKASAPNPGGAVALLATLTVKGRAAKTGYSREQFGPDWPDVDHNGCDTRDDILRRDLVDITYRSDDPTCTVATGTLHDPYTGKTIEFVRGVGTSEAVQIDHLVALSDAWQKGAQQWTADKREQFANDPVELLAVDGPTNEQKGDGDAATWLPPNKSYRCAYVSEQIQVKAKYRLWVTQAEHDAMVQVLASCGATVPTQTPTPKASPTPTKAPAPVKTTAPADVYYPNCAAARAAGVAPLYVGEPGYRSGLDRDHDGVACE